VAGLPQLPDRAYEIVSPYPTEGVPVFPRAGSVSISEDGDRVNLGTFQPFPGSETPPPQDQEHIGDARWNYVAKRGTDGWHLQETGFSESGWGRGWSADGKRYLFSTATGGDVDHRLAPDDQNGDPVYSPGGQDVYQWQPDGSVVWISRDPRIPVGTPQTARENAVLPSGVSPGAYSMSFDGRTVVFSSRRSLSDEDTTPPGVPQLYKWQDGELSFIGKRPDGSVPSEGTGLGVATAGGWSEDPSGDPNIQGAVSRDGRRVVFSAFRRDSGEGKMIYVQTDGQPTVEAVKETGVPPLPGDQPFYPTYHGASADASRVFFTTNSRLTPDSGASATWPGGDGKSGDPDLYVYDVNADKVRDLTPRLDGVEDPTVDPAAADRAHVQGVAAYSEDGKRVYFVADAQYDVAPNPQGDLPSPEGRNLYMAELEGIDDPVKLRFIAALGPDDRAAWRSTLSENKSAYASPSGSVLGFGSTVPLTGQNLGGTTQLFVYDAEAETLACASCPSDGSLPVSSVNQDFLVGSSEWQERYSEKRWVSSRGQVFFDTATPLVSEDQNLVTDVYEYLGGQLRLVSAGAGTRPSTFENATEDGDTVLINTLDALVPQDEEPGIPKLYAARVGGGFPAAAKTPACDLGAGACEGAPTKPPGLSGAGTAAFEGPGDKKAKNAGKRCPKGKRRVKRRGKVRCAPGKTRKHSQKRNAKHNRRASR
jgi:Tol biopolymer transport system component